MMIDCNKTENYLKFKNKMCKATNCKNCQLDSSNNGEYASCNRFTEKYPERAIEIVQKWVNEHCKTRAEYMQINYKKQERITQYENI